MGKDLVKDVVKGTPTKSASGHGPDAAHKTRLPRVKAWMLCVAVTVAAFAFALVQWQRGNPLLGGTGPASVFLAVLGTVLVIG